MGYRYTQQNDDVTYKVNSYVADTKADVAFIDVTNDEPGTTCIVLEDSSVYMLDTQKDWREL